MQVKSAHTFRTMVRQADTQQGPVLLPRIEALLVVQRDGEPHRIEGASGIHRPPKMSDVEWEMSPDEARVLARDLMLAAERSEALVKPPQTDETEEVPVLRVAGTSAETDQLPWGIRGPILGRADRHLWCPSLHILDVEQGSAARVAVE